MWKCPHCNEKIEYLEFIASTKGWESGTVSLSNDADNRELEDHDYNDSGTDDTYDYEYTCPECSRHIQTEDLIWYIEDEDEEIQKVIPNEPEETLHKIIQPTNKIIIEIQPKNVTDFGIICKNKKCQYIFVYEGRDASEEELFECPQCQEVTSKKEYLLTMQKHDRKKT